MFSEWRVSEVRTCFLAETMAQVLPAAFSLLLALPVRISLSPSEQKHTAHPARNNPPPSQKFTSCTSALLLHADPIPKTCIYNPPHTETALGRTGGLRSRKTSSPPSTPQLEAIFKPCTHRTARALSSLFPPAQNRSDKENTCENMCVLF